MTRPTPVVGLHYVALLKPCFYLVRFNPFNLILMMLEPAMIAPISALLNAVHTGKASFDDVLNFINDRYTFTPTAFSNGALSNAAGENNGSCRVFAFAQLHNLSANDTLSLFAEHYKSVAANPAGADHQNIRQFKKNGWAGLMFKGHALHSKPVVTETVVDQTAI
jgi:hypothetical protein